MGTLDNLIKVTCERLVWLSAGHTQTSISTSICTEPPHLIHDDEDDEDESDDEEDEEDKENEEDEGDGAGWEV